MKTAARTMGAANGRLLLTAVALSLASLRLALATRDELQLPAFPVDLAVLGRGDGVELALVDRVLKVGGVAAVLAASRSAPQLPGKYKIVVKSEGAAVAAEKTGASTGSAAVARRHHRKLLAVAGNKEDVLDGLEGVLLEPPQRRHAVRRLRPKYLPELTGDSLEGYRRRVFIDVAPAPGGGAASWFRKHYPRGRHEFESVRLTAAGAAEAAEGIGDWLEGNVGEEDYVVVKAGVEAAEEMLRKGAAVVRRVDELFLDCGEGSVGRAAGNGNSGRRPYWQCLALYGRLRDQGVAVHQWWRGYLTICHSYECRSFKCQFCVRSYTIIIESLRT
ncbi:unnamed protein product [Urochloa humidicola]